jgi:hypothetical protein
MKTKSEELFEKFLTDNNVTFEKIKEDTTPRPDYLVSVGSAQVIFELKELAEDEKFDVVKDPKYPHITSSSRTVGDHVRRRIESSKRQIQFGAKQGIPSALLIHNNIDPIQMFGTESMDFIAAMYGAYTILLNKQTMAASEMFNGKDRMLQPQKNTSFSAVGHLCDRGGTITVTLFENVCAKVSIPRDQLPPCFDVPKIEVSTEPLTLP